MIGVGGAGVNVVEHMIGQGLQGVEFICANTDIESLCRSSARTKVRFGWGLGTAGRPELGRNLAQKARSRLTEVLNGADLVFIVTGIGGGTGTGAAPVVAEVAHELGILTVAAVSTPFEFEGRRVDVAWKGIKELGRHADAVILFPNEILVEALGDKITMLDAFRFVDQQVINAVGGIAGIVSPPGLINIDIADVGSTITGAGHCASGSATATGSDRASGAVHKAMLVPSMRLIPPLQRRRVLFSITSGRTVGLNEVAAVFRAIRDQAADDAMVLGGATYDDSLGDWLRVSVIVAGSGTSLRSGKSRQHSVMRGEGAWL